MEAVETLKTLREGEELRRGAEKLVGTVRRPAVRKEVVVYQMHREAV